MFGWKSRKAKARAAEYRLWCEQRDREQERALANCRACNPLPGDDDFYYVQPHTC